MLASRCWTSRSRSFLLGEEVVRGGDLLPDLVGDLLLCRVGGGDRSPILMRSSSNAVVLKILSLLLLVAGTDDSFQ